MKAASEKLSWVVVHRRFLNWVIVGAALKFILLVGAFILYFPVFVVYLVAIFAAAGSSSTLSGGQPYGVLSAVFRIVTATLALASIAFLIHKARHPKSNRVFVEEPEPRQPDTFVDPGSPGDQVPQQAFGAGHGIVSPPLLGLPVGIASFFAGRAILRLLADLGGHFWSGTPCYECSGHSYLFLGVTLTISVGCIMLYRRLFTKQRGPLPVADG